MKFPSNFFCYAYQYIGEIMLVKKGQNNKIINLHEKTVIYTSRFVYIYGKIRIYINIRIYTARFVYKIYIYIKICIYKLRFLHKGKHSMTAGSIIVFSNGDRKMAAYEEAIDSLLRRIYRVMTEEMTPASNVEEELSRVFFFSRVGAQQPPLCNPRVNYGSNGRSGKKGRLRA